MLQVKTKLPVDTLKVWTQAKVKFVNRHGRKSQRDQNGCLMHAAIVPCYFSSVVMDYI